MHAAVWGSGPSGAVDEGTWLVSLEASLQEPVPGHLFPTKFAVLISHAYATI